MSEELAQYIADYVNEEWEQKGAAVAYAQGSMIRMKLYAQPVDTDMILKAIEGFEHE